MSVKNENIYLGDLLKGEYEDRDYTRETTLLAADPVNDLTLKLGTVLGKIIKGAAVGAAVGGNTGNGTITAVPTLLAGSKAGVYTAQCVETAAGAGKFEVFGPNGALIGIASVGVQFDKQVQFTIAAGNSDFVLGDKFTITVAAGSGKVVQLNPAAVDGSECAYGVLLYDTTVPHTVDTKGTLLARGPARLSSEFVIWPAGIQAADKAAATAALAAKQIVIPDVSV